MNGSQISRKGFALLGLILALVMIRAAAGLADWGLSEQAAQKHAIESIESGQPPFYALGSRFANAAPAARVLMVKNGLAWAKAFSQTALFKKEYERVRQSHKPEGAVLKSAEQQMAEQQSESAKAIAEMKKNLANLPAEMREEMKKTIAELEKAQQEQSQNKEAQELSKQMFALDNEEKKRQNAADLEEWAKKYPADSQRWIAAKLHAFLETCADVDFDAKTVSSNGKRRFTNPDYESQSSNWKICFRAGREPVEAARQFANSWLAELPQ